MSPSPVLQPTPNTPLFRPTSPHPAEFTDDVIEAMAATPTVCPQLHMPLQSGSDRVLRAMRRSYRSERFLDRKSTRLNSSQLYRTFAIGSLTHHGYIR